MTIRSFMNGLRQRVRPASRATRRRSQPLTLEVLDDRLLPAVTAPPPVGGLWTITGDANPNTIFLFASGGMIRVVGDSANFAAPEGKVSVIDVRAVGGSDVVTVEGSLPNTITKLTIDGGDGAKDQLKTGEQLFDVFAEDYTVTRTTITRHSLTVPISYGHFDEIVINAPDITGLNLDNTFNIESLDTNLTINADVGDDTINFCPTSRNLTNILVQDTVTINGGGGKDAIHLYDQNNATNLAVGDTYTIGNTNVGRSWFSGVTFDGGTDSIVLHASPDNNIYRVNKGASVPLRVEDAGGTDTLDFTAWTTGVTIDLPAGTATGLTGGISGIDNALGGSGKDKMTGDTLGNYFVGYGDADELIGGDGRDILVGGVGADVLAGGPGDDILIGGSTSHDSYPLIDSRVLAFNTIMAEWQRTDLSYSQRIASIRNTIAYRLNSTTVTLDNDADTMRGGTEWDWFWGIGPLTLVPPGTVRDSMPDWVRPDPFRPGSGERIN